MILFLIGPGSKMVQVRISQGAEWSRSRFRMVQVLISPGSEACFLLDKFQKGPSRILAVTFLLTFTLTLTFFCS
jgi:hypothetical protein